MDVSADHFSMTVGANPETSQTQTPEEVAQSMEPAKLTKPPKPPPRVQVQTDQTVDVTNGGYDPVTGRRYPAGVHTGTGVGVGVGDPRGPAPPPADPGLDPRYPNPTAGAGATQGPPQSLRDKLEEKALPEGRIAKAVAGYIYFPEVSPRLKNSSEPYHLVYAGPAGEIHLTVPAK